MMDMLQECTNYNMIDVNFLFFFCCIKIKVETLTYFSIGATKARKVTHFVSRVEHFPTAGIVILKKNPALVDNFLSLWSFKAGNFIIDSFS